MKGLFKHISLFAAALFAFAGCSDDREALEPMQKMAAEFDLSFVAQTDEEGNVDHGVLEEYFIDGRSVIIISQRANALSLNFNETTTDAEGNEIRNDNLYKYVYYNNPAANWEEYANFQPYGDRALDWEYIGNYGFGGEFSLAALYYPVGYNIYNMVEQDQSSDDNIRRSNVLGAWHKTNVYQDRLKFAFYHIMEAIKVTLLIPVWKAEDNSGFGADAVKRGELLNIANEFDVTWGANLSTEQSPAAEAKGEPCDIIMHLESVENEPRKIRYNDSTGSFPEDEDEVRTATFVVLFPPQQVGLNGPAMRFVLQTMGEQEKSYVWNTRDMENSISSEGGIVHNLILYLPRKASNAILIKSYILDWIEADSQFTVIPDDEMEE